MDFIEQLQTLAAKTNKLCDVLLVFLSDFYCLSLHIP